MSINHLEQILARKRGEVARRRRRQSGLLARRGTVPLADTAHLGAALRRAPGAPPRVIAELKTQSPSAGVIRPRHAGMLAHLAQSYERGGAAAVSVLTDFQAFAGCPLDVRRVVNAVRVPVLFKEFVLDEVQLALASAVGATYVLLLVRALDESALRQMIDASRAWGLEPIVEAADDAELTTALATSARIVGVNARDLRNFTVDSASASQLVERIPKDRVSVYMSGIRSREAFARIAALPVDAVLIGEGLMQQNDPGATLETWLSHA